jgi:hypothetical protein
MMIQPEINHFIQNRVIRIELRDNCIRQSRFYSGNHAVPRFAAGTLVDQRLSVEEVIQMVLQRPLISSLTGGLK